jgi:hypothetical protein
MKKGRGYLLVFTVPAVLAAAVGAIAVFAAAAGFAWLFVFGDDPWSATGESILMAIALTTFAALLVALLRFAYALGLREEERGSPNFCHVGIAVGVTALLVAAIAFHQFHVGNFGATHESILCADFCRDAGIAGASEIPAQTAGVRTCVCLDVHGRAATSAPIGEILRKRER